MAIKAGIIGISDGNGHPYSWSAIANGFDLELIRKCGYPVISQYLEDKKSLPLNKDFEISHIYCNDLNEAKFISRACNIRNICLSIQEMTSQVDCFIVAKSDYWNHQELLGILAPSNLPIMIDKPMHVSLDGLYQLYNLESYKGQFFTCSSSRFSNNFQRFINQLGKNDDIHCETLNTWELYSVHLIDPLVHFGIISSRDEFQAKKRLNQASVK